MLSQTEELIIYGMLVVVGAIPVITSLEQRAVFGVEATVGLMMVVAGVVGAIAYALRGRDRHAS